MYMYIYIYIHTNLNFTGYRKELTLVLCFPSMVHMSFLISLLSSFMALGLTLLPNPQLLLAFFIFCEYEWRIFIQGAGFLDTSRKCLLAWYIFFLLRKIGI